MKGRVQQLLGRALPGEAATVHALEDSELMKIEEDELRELIRHHPYMKDVLSRYHLDRVTATAETLKAFMKRERVEGIVS